MVNVSKINNNSVEFQQLMKSELGCRECTKHGNCLIGFKVEDGSCECGVIIKYKYSVKKPKSKVEFKEVGSTCIMVLPCILKWLRRATCKVSYGRTKEQEIKWHFNTIKKSRGYIDGVRVRNDLLYGTYSNGW